jgi:TonB family protein
MTPYQLKKQKRRTLISFLAALLLHLLVVAGVLLYDYLFVEDLSDYSGPVLVKLGEPEGADIPVLPEEEASEEQSASESLPELVNPEVNEAPPELPAPVEPVSETAEILLPEETVEPREPAVEDQPEESSEPQVETVFGEEAGNSWEYQYESGGRVGRSLGAEMYLYMPLPRFIPRELFDRVDGDSYSPGTSRQTLILRYYEPLNDEYSLQYNPLSDDVRAIWDYLIDAGYDYQNADYKADGYLRPVVLKFTVSPGEGLIDAKIERSSGDSAVDDAVLEGFMNATFSNTADREINGRFTYRFD